jgi:hypothetical protein
MLTSVDLIKTQIKNSLQSIHTTSTVVRMEVQPCLLSVVKPILRSQLWNKEKVVL